MKIYAINGGPRKEWNTATMLGHFLEGAASAGSHVETELIHLFDLKYTGCISCFSCKRPGRGYARCAVRDGIHDLLQQLPLADGIVFGSPIYFHDITAQLRGLLERLFFQYHSFEKGEKSLAPKKVPTAIIYTMNVTEDVFRRDGYAANLRTTESYFDWTFYAKSELLYAFNTYEFNDYGRYKASYWDEPEKAAWRKKQFPLDCRAAFEAGRRMAGLAPDPA